MSGRQGAAAAGNDLVVLSAGAAKGLVTALAPRLREATGAGVAATFGAVGTVRDQFLAQGPCDVLILTAPMLEALGADGKVVRDTIRSLGEVHTGVAVRSGEAHPRVADRADLARCFAHASALYCPDTKQSTAGRHFVAVLAQLGLWPAAAAHLREYPSGAIAMRAMADDASPGAVGCTQVTEILYTPGVELVGCLPRGFELATTYSVAVATRAAQSALARRFATMLTGAEHAALRAEGGFVQRA